MSKELLPSDYSNAEPFRRKQLPVHNSTGSTAPFETRRQAVAGLQESLSSMAESAKAELCHVLADCFAHGHGAATSFEKALEYLEQAARHESRSAEAILVRITCAVRGLAPPPTMDTLQCVDDAQILLQQRAFELERRLHCQTNNSNSLVARVKEWTKWEIEVAQTRPCLVWHDQGHTLTIPEATEISFLRLLESNQLKSLSTDLVTISTIFHTEKQYYIPHLFATLGWIEALHWIKQHDIRHLSSNGGSVVVAAMNGQADVVRFLLANGETASPSEDRTKIAHHFNGLHFLSWFDDPDVEAIAGLLCTHGANPNMVSPTGESVSISLAGPDFSTSTNGPPLNMAIVFGDRRAVGVLLKLGADPLLQVQISVERQAHTPLGLAVALHMYDIVEDILTHISSAETPKPRPWKGLLMQLAGHVLGGKAMFWRWLLHGDGYQAACHRTIQTCLKHGATIDYNEIERSSPLITVASSGPNQIYVLEALLLCGADPNVQGSSGWTVLGSLRTVGYSPEDKARAMKLLIRHGAGVNLANALGKTPLHLHTEANSIATLRILLEHGANVNVEAESDRKRTPLQLAARLGRVECLNMLLDHGADIDALSCEHPTDPTYTGRDWSRTALDMASLFGHASCVRALLSRGPTVLAPRKAGLILGYAIQQNRLEVVQVLLREYPDVFAKKEVLQVFNTMDCTSLSHAAFHESISALLEVLRVGPELDFRDVNVPKSGTALSLAVRYGRVENAIRLVELGASPFCIGDPAEENISYIREFLSWESNHISLKTRLPELILGTKSCVDRHNLMKSRDWMGLTALQFCVCQVQFDALVTLVQYGASVYDEMTGMRNTSWNETPAWYLQDIRGLTVLDFARRLRHCNSDQRKVWFSRIKNERSMEDMDRIIEYLERIMRQTSEVPPPHREHRTVSSALELSDIAQMAISPLT